MEMLWHEQINECVQLSLKNYKEYVRVSNQQVITMLDVCPKSQLLAIHIVILGYKFILVNFINKKRKFYSNHVL